MQLPADVMAMILQYLGMPDLNHTTEPRYAHRLRAIRRQMILLSDDFASDTPSENRYSDAYFVYNFPLNMAKTMHVIKEIRLRYADFFLNRDHYDLLDIGCGEGAGMFGAYHALRNKGLQRVKLVGIDGSKRMLDRAKYLAARFRAHDPGLKTRFFRQRIQERFRFASKKKYDIVLVINSLAEIIQEAVISSRFIISILKHLTNDGLLLIIEPALKKFSRRLMRLRDELALQKDVQVLLPCFHGNPCGLLEIGSRNEWCHQSVPWLPPQFLKIINQGLNREIDVLKFAYLVLTKGKARLDRPEGYRVVSQLLREKGKSRCFICTPQGRVELVKLNRSHDLRNADFDAITKGSVVHLEDVTIKKNNYWQVIAQTVVTIRE